MLALAIAIIAGAQSPANVRYVRSDGSNSNDGKSWATAMKDVQNAINSLTNNGLKGEVWVAAGTYKPTESMNPSSTSKLYYSFMIPAGITVRGGFAGTESTAADRAKTPHPTMGWFYTNKTVLSGDLQRDAQFIDTWDGTKYVPVFYNSSYHVVWFGLNGVTLNSKGAASGRYNPLAGTATLEGCEVVHGNAKYTKTSGFSHIGYGGGIYMVGGSVVENCYVHECQASRNGGGIFMDYGGKVVHTYVADCQALGIGTNFGFGGGICANDYNADTNASVERSAVVNCVARMGGGASVQITTSRSYKYRLGMSSVLLANNTALTEGGGLYLHQGGAVSQLTVVNNECKGTGSITNDMTTGRSAGIYVRDNAYIANTIMWGGKCTANNDVQFACSQSNTSYKPFLKYSYLTAVDFVDWSGVNKTNVNKISAYNTKAAQESAGATASYGTGYPQFLNPGLVVGHIDGGASPASYTYNWKLQSRSALASKGILTCDLDNSATYPTHQYSAMYDVLGEQYSSHSSIGAYCAEAIGCVPLVEGSVAKVFVDPDFDGDGSADAGKSWDNPTLYLADVLSILSDFKSTGDYAAVNEINVYVKEGTMQNINTRDSERIRLSSFRIPRLSGIQLNIYGGFDSELEGTDISKRNPVLTPTILTGNIMGTYSTNVAHLVTFDNVSNVTFDGFQIRYANASTEEINHTYNGAAFTFNNATDIKVKNCLVAGCKADNGAAVYAVGNSTVDFENCIFHNNTGYYSIKRNGVSTTSNGGIIYSADNSRLTFNHCDVLRNVGYASQLEGTSTNVWRNSVLYANLNKSIVNTDAATDKQKLASFTGSNKAGVSGENCFFDAKSASFSSQFDGNTKFTLAYDYDSGTNFNYPRFINPTKNSGVSETGDKTLYGRATSFEPHNNSPLVNTASYVGANLTWGTDMSATVTRDHGGRPDVGAIENHYSTFDDNPENANTDGQSEFGNILYVKDYNEYDKDGNITKEDTSIDGRDGMSWQTAINGNGEYPVKKYELYAYKSNGKDYSSTSIDAPDRKVFKIGVTEESDSLRQRHFVCCNSTSEGTLNSTKYFRDGDSFVILLADSKKNAFYIYDLTQKKYVAYKDKEEGADKVVLQDGTDGNTKWYITSRNTNVNMRTTIIIPFDVPNADTSVSWCYYGGFGNNVGLLAGKDDNNIKWQFYLETESTINGLQYAVNNQSHAYLSDSLNTNRKAREVWVAAGIYSKDNERYIKDYFTIDNNTYGDESCFVIRDGVKVFGAFPKNGNPGKKQRQALVSKYINNSRGYRPEDYESILCPKSRTIVTGVTRRILGSPYSYSTSTKNPWPVYNGAEWDGFTLTGGYTDAVRIRSSRGNGGAGACVLQNVTLRNCVVTNNILLFPNGYGSAGTQDKLYKPTDAGASGGECRGGGVFVKRGTVEQCYIINNEIRETTGVNSTVRKASGSFNTSGGGYGAGLYGNVATIFNCVIANNLGYCDGSEGAGLFVDGVSNIFNNTIINNKSITRSRGSGGVAIWASGTENIVEIHNSIIANNEGLVRQANWAAVGNENIFIPRSGYVTAKSCLTDLPTGQTHVVSKKDTKQVADLIIDGSCVTITPEQFKDLFVSDPGNYQDLDVVAATGGATTDMNLRLKSGSMAINAGNSHPIINGVGYDLEKYNDMDYALRVQDCTIDIGAYEFNDAYSITPDLTTVPGQAIYYVIPEGRGLASADCPENAACSEKMQRVLDAAGRYKFQNPEKQVVVKVANSYTLHESGNDYKYFATRTTDETTEDARVWSIIIPRGVEVWGGYTDKDYSTDSWTNESNGFYVREGETVTDRRDITGNPTYFESYYTRTDDDSKVQTYHVVSFTDRLFDGQGMPYLKGDNLGNVSSYNPETNYTDDDFMLISANVSGEGNRAVLDGIYVQGGSANAETLGEETSAVNINQCGGAAIVTDYAHVRNCIITGNSANYGGALALRERALVSGCVITDNTADNGGAVYVFEPDQELSDGTTVNTDNGDGDASLDANMPHIYTSTIVNNKANIEGGGLWFTSENTPNVRVNSCVIWENEANEQSNVAGQISPSTEGKTQYSSTEFYPFSYCAVQNVRMMGTNNIGVDTENANGIRFARNGNMNEIASIGSGSDRFAEFVNFGLSRYSALLNAGMPKEKYASLVENLSLNAEDFTGVARDISENGSRKNIDIGARALLKDAVYNQLMLRLYVANFEDIDVTAVQAMETSGDSYYEQEGSSFAYPMKSLQDAIDYIKMYRTNQTELSTRHPENLPFEIVMSRGEYYPSKGLNGTDEYSFANTFAIPEGVSVTGGFYSLKDAGSNTFFGKYNTPKADVASYTENLAGNVEATGEESVTVNGYTLRQLPLEDMLSTREMSDQNSNNIIEPWEFEHKTVLSGKMSASEAANAYHVISVVADQNVMGMLPKAAGIHDDVYNNSDIPTGTMIRETGQPVALDGLVISDGAAYSYNDLSMDEMSSYSYYHGGGILIDGNRYCNDWNVQRQSSYDFSASHDAVYLHTGVSNAVGYRNIPLYITNCKFQDNLAGYGGAISSNGSVEVFSSVFEHNIAKYGVDNFTKNGNAMTVKYPGQGGAVYGTYQLNFSNTLFANNEAYNEGHSIVPAAYPTLRNQNPSTLILGGCGGAIYGGLSSHFHILNCDIVRNKANMYPAVFTMNPNKDMSTSEGWPNIASTAYNPIMNSVFWGNELEEATSESTNSYYKFAAPMICNYGRADRHEAYDPTFVSGIVAGSMTELEEQYAETAWFSAYEAKRGMAQNNKQDLREIACLPSVHTVYQITSQAENNEYQNCNVEINSDNGETDGPCFTGPSDEAGYNGYNANANWSPSGRSKYTDQGSGYICQTNSGAVNYATYTAEEIASLPSSRKAVLDENAGDCKSDGAYTSAHFRKASPLYRKNLPVGNERYMWTVTGDDREAINRLSLNRDLGVDKAYIDMGLYEYKHTSLKFDDAESGVDVIWVSQQEKLENGDADGSSWDTPTSKLQEAIVSLLAKRNGHRKEIRLIEGTYTPTKGSDNNYSFLVDSKSINDWEPDNSGQGVMSLTFKGGYSFDIPDEYNVEEYPVILMGATRTDGSDAYNHVFHIKDATQRYGIADYSSKSFGYGWWRNQDDKDNGVTVFPIQIDGVSIVNDQAKSNVKGAAVCYEDQAFDIDDGAGVYYANAAGYVDVTAVTYYTDDTHAEVSDVPTLFYTIGDDPVRKESPAKFIMTRCKIYGSGTKDEADKTSSAVYVGQYGGKALIYNNVFHSNFGKPLVAYSAQTVNNTFALNGGAVDLKNTTANDTYNASHTADVSYIFNTAMWKNNPTNAARTKFGSQFTLEGYVSDEASGDIFQYNAYTGCTNTLTNYAATSGEPAAPSDMALKHFNVNLSNVSSTLTTGPNFADAENPVVSLRNFNILPSIRMLNRGNSDVYVTDLNDAKCNILDISALPGVWTDASTQRRLAGSAIDLGAYEYQKALSQVLYVDPNVSVSGDGNTWASPLGYGKIQDAIDMAAIFSINNSGRLAYVFVKGASAINKGLHTGETITMRNGVNVYGSVPVDYSTIANIAGVSTSTAASRLAAYAKDIVAARAGIASPSANLTTIAGVNMTGTSWSRNRVAVLDGFDITPNKDDEFAVVTAPAVSMSIGNQTTYPCQYKVALRNAIIHDFDVSDQSADLVTLQNTFAYNILVRDNKVGSSYSTVNVGEAAVLLNATVDGVTNDTHTTYGGVFNSVANMTESQKAAIAGYSYSFDDRNLDFQLGEQSRAIDGGENTPLSESVYDYYKALFDYSTDKDLLGNPRLNTLLSADAKVDNGAFETWRVETDVQCTKDIYPHEGSAVYVMPGKSLVLDPVTGKGAREGDFRPSYLLLKVGSSLYGNGRDVNVNYLGVEREVRADGSIVSMPFAMNYRTGVTKPSYSVDGGLTLETDAPKVYAYDSSERADWKYSFASENSPCWKLIDNSTVTNACAGVLYKTYFDEDDACVLRFTCKGENADEFVYTENGNIKTVVLAENNNDNSGYDASFTSKENMGWNAIGVPYLVSGYSTCGKNYSGGSKYNMNLPHEMWLYYDGKKCQDGVTDVNGDGGYYSVSSWDDTDWHLAPDEDAVVWMGEGIFVQTAKFSGDEELSFCRPVYTAPASPARKRTNTRYYIGNENPEKDIDIADSSKAVYSVYVRNHTLHIENLEGGEIISIFSADGRLEKKTVSDGSSFSCTLTPGVHVIKINGSPYKVM